MPDVGTRQSILKKIKNTFLCRVLTCGTRQRGSHRDLTITAAFLCRVPSWHSANPLPSARHTALGKEAFVVKGYVDSSLPSAAFGKGFVLVKALPSTKPSLPSAIALGKARVSRSEQTQTTINTHMHPRKPYPYKHL